MWTNCVIFYCIGRLIFLPVKILFTFWNVKIDERITIVVLSVLLNAVIEFHKARGKSFFFNLHKAEQRLYLDAKKLPPK